MHRLVTYIAVLATAFIAATGISAAQVSEILVEAESFTEKGGWVTDQQFMDLMGSPYLLAHGMGKPVADAAGSLEVPADGVYHVYARTFNWTSPWSSKEGPGKFNIRIGKKTLKTVLGASGNAWMWQIAGSIRLGKGTTGIALKDLTGFDGRCDAIYLTTGNEAPSSDAESVKALRDRLLPKGEPRKAGYDFVVIGGGIAGMCAAVAAARGGCKVALVNDRPVLGGNNSSEVRVHLGGIAEVGPNEGLGRMLREFGHTRQGNAMPAENYEDWKKDAFIAGEPDVTLYAPWRAVGVNMDGNRISSVIIQDIHSGEQTELSAPLFDDCTGDGTIGYLAGVQYLMGRESREQYGESMAPEKADKMTMGASVQWYSKDTGHRTGFPQFSYGIDFNETNAPKVFKGEWTWETGMNLDQINDFERIRDYGLLVIYSNWSFLKNGLRDNRKWQNRDLDWVAYISGKRESRRILGDYVLKQDDIDKNVWHEDRSFTTTWDLDLHFPDPENSEQFPGNEFKAATKHVPIYPYAVPYRCLYSRDVDNLFMAGRDISVTHVALGSVRVMRTTGMMGEVTGVAASLCKKYGTTPRGIFLKYLPELQALMKEGAGKKGLPDTQTFNFPGQLKHPRALVKEQ